MTEYSFLYSYDVKLKSGKIFKRSGEMKGFSVSNIKSKLPEGCNPTINPVIKNLVGADAVFYTTIDKASKYDKPN